MTSALHFQWVGRVYRPLPANPSRLQLLKRAELFARDACNGAFTNGTQWQSTECVKAHTAIVAELDAEMANNG